MCSRGFWRKVGFTICLGRRFRMKSDGGRARLTPLPPKTTNCIYKDFHVNFLEHPGHCQARGRYVMRAVWITMNTYKRFI